MQPACAPATLLLPDALDSVLSLCCFAYSMQPHPVIRSHGTIGMHMKYMQAQCRAWHLLRLNLLLLIKCKVLVQRAHCQMTLDQRTL